MIIFSRLNHFPQTSTIYLQSTHFDIILLAGIKFLNHCQLTFEYQIHQYSCEHLHRCFFTPIYKCQGATRGGPGCAKFVCRIFFVSSGSRPNALSFCLYHGYRLRQKKGRKKRAEYFCSSHPDPSFLSVSRLI